MHCLVTGASGYLGRSLVPALATSGHWVRACCHRGEAPSTAHEVIRGDLSDEALDGSLDTLLAGVDTVIHLAGIAHQRAHADDYRRVNRDTSIALARAARDAGAKRFIFVSSVKAAEAVSKPAAEPAPETLDYASSKREAEKALETLCANEAMELVILRPALVYGDQESGHLALLRRWVQWHLPAPPVGGSLAMICRDDLTALLCALVAHSNGPPSMITATDGEHYSTQRLHRAYCRALHKNPWLPSLPVFAWRLASAARDVLAGAPRGSTWERLAGESHHESSGMDALGFSPRLTFERKLGV